MPGYFISEGDPVIAFEDLEGDLSTDPFRPFQLDWQFGGAYQINENLKVNLTYNYSLLSLRGIKSNGIHYNWFSKMLGLNKGNYSNSVQLGMYYIF